MFHPVLRPPSKGGLLGCRAAPAWSLVTPRCGGSAHRSVHFMESRNNRLPCRAVLCCAVPRCIPPAAGGRVHQGPLRLGLQLQALAHEARGHKLVGRARARAGAGGPASFGCCVRWQPAWGPWACPPYLHSAQPPLPRGKVTSEHRVLAHKSPAYRCQAVAFCACMDQPHFNPVP